MPQITHFDAVPTTLRRLLEAAPDRIPSSLRLISYASERMPTALITALIERMPAVSFVQFYGMIEHLCLTVLGASDQLRKIGTVGRPDGGGGAVSRGRGRSAGRAWGNRRNRRPESDAVRRLLGRPGGDSRASCADTAMRTGDLGRFDDDGFLLAGRPGERGDQDRRLHGHSDGDRSGADVASTGQRCGGRGHAGRTVGRGGPRVRDSRARNRRWPRPSCSPSARNGWRGTNAPRPFISWRSCPGPGSARSRGGSCATG